MSVSLSNPLYIKNIGKTLKEIFTDPDVVKAANDCANFLALSFGKMIGSFASIGITIASNLTGGIEGYLSKSSSYIRCKLVSLFNIAGDIASLAGDFWTAFAGGLFFSLVSSPCCSCRLQI